MDSKIMTIKNVRAYQDKNGVAQLNTEDVARGLGFIENKNGIEYIIWRRVKQYLIEFGFDTCVENEKIPEYIPENIFYKLCFKAKNEIARKFQDLVTDEILPAIRQTGGYVVGEKEMDEDEMALATIQMLQRKIERKNMENKRLLEESNHKDLIISTKDAIIESQNKDLVYFNFIKASPSAMKISQIAADYGLTATEMNYLLAAIGFQYKVNGQWILYSGFKNFGLTVSETKIDEISHTEVEVISYFTQKGRYRIYTILKDIGILPECERDDNDDVGLQIMVHLINIGKRIIKKSATCKYEMDKEIKNKVGMAINNFKRDEQVNKIKLCIDKYGKISDYDMLSIDCETDDERILRDIRNGRAWQYGEDILLGYVSKGMLGIEEFKKLRRKCMDRRKFN